MIATVKSQELTYPENIALPPVCGIVVFNRTFHVFKGVEDGEHVDELAESEQVGFRHEILPPFLVRKPLHLRHESLDGLFLKSRKC